MMYTCSIWVTKITNTNFVEHLCGMMKCSEKIAIIKIQFFSFYCGNGKVKIPLLKEPIEILKKLVFRHDHRSKKNFGANLWV